MIFFTLLTKWLKNICIFYRYFDEIDWILSLMSTSTKKYQAASVYHSLIYIVGMFYLLKLVLHIIFQILKIQRLGSGKNAIFSYRWNILFAVCTSYHFCIMNNIFHKQTTNRPLLCQYIKRITPFAFLSLF